MLEAPKSLITSALVSLVPRQIMLASKPQAVYGAKIKDKEMKSEKKKKNKSKAKQSETLELLLNSIASFLQSNGFDKTLAVFRSEAQIESDDLKASDINLEDVFCKFLDSSKGHEEARVDLQRDAQKSTASKKDESENAHDVSEEIHKKIRKHKKEKNEGVKPDEHGSEKSNNEPNDLGYTKDIEKLNSAEDSCVETKDKKRKKKHKMSSDACDEDTKCRDSKNVKEIIEEKIGELKSLIDSSSLPSESNAKEKCEKKKKLKATLDYLAENGNGYTKNDLEEKSAVPVNDDNIEKKSHKKRKRLASEEKSLQSENNTEFTTPQKPDNTVRDNEQTLTSKKRKTEKSTEAADQISKKSLKEHDSSAQDVQKESGEHKLSNGNLEKSGKEGETASKSKKKEKPSAEPKTVNAFQRVKVDEVKFIDERLQDNSYWALDSTGSGYGAKAQEILQQVKGRDFRHEKTKKKRGTYRGGQIDESTRSVKFNYSDDE